MSDLNLYTVLWISALSTEYQAAQQFLDEKQDQAPLVLSPGDTNHYTLGKIANHHVVLTVLPAGEYGGGSAADAMSNALRSFHNIKIGLMVGLGGGAPALVDIRLGDVVVSTPKDGRGGVFQYDFGKAIQGRNYKCTGFLNQPNRVVRNAVNALATKYESDGHQIVQNIESILETKPRLRIKYGRPAKGSDRLYEPSFIHADDSQKCLTSCGLDHIIERRPRGELEDDPAIHRGLMASGNTVIKDARFRDQLARTEGVLCFEMEAAGLMNRFPCLVIRGICDYSDSHKNKIWQGWAAMTAAAYTKDLLKEINPIQVKGQETLAKLEQLSNDIRAITTSVEQIRVHGATTGNTEWLRAPDPSANYNKARKMCFPDTGQWLLTNEKFLEWEEQPNSFLWLHGASGSGKTVLSSIVINRILTGGNLASTVFFYFDFSDQDKQHFEAMLRSILMQLYHKSDEAKHVIRSLYDACDRGTRQPSLEQMNGTLKSILEKLGNISLIVDALDESQSTNEIIQWCKDLHSSKNTKLRLLLTSQTQVVDWPDANQILLIHPEDANADIRTYIHRRLQDTEYRRLDSQLSKEVEKTLTEKAGGMDVFRWAALQLDIMRQCRSKDAIEDALDHLPETLNDTYSRMLVSIEAGKHFRQAVIILQMLVWSDRRLNIAECNDAIAVRLQENPGLNRNRRFLEPHDIVNILSGLVTEEKNDEHSNADDCHLRLSHASVKEYLQSNKTKQSFQVLMDEQNARLAIWYTCLTYLRSVDWAMVRLGGPPLTEYLGEVDEGYPFTYWACHSWIEQAKHLEGTHDDVLIWMLSLLQDDTGVFETFSRFHIKNTWASEDRCYPIDFAVMNGLTRACKHLGTFDIYLSGLLLEPDTSLLDPLDHGELSETLVSSAASTSVHHRLENAQTRIDTALKVASAQGYDDIVQSLLRHGARVNSMDQSQTQQHGAGQGAFNFIGWYCWAIAAQTTPPVFALLSIGLERDSGATALYQAALVGCSRIVKILLAYGADPNLRCGAFGNALIAAIANRHESIVEVLIAQGADVNCCPQGLRPLQVACMSGQLSIAQTLVREGAAVSFASELGSPLMLARSSARSVRSLTPEALVNLTEAGQGRTALQRAAPFGHRNIVRELNHDMRHNSVGRGRNPLHHVASMGLEQIVRILLDQGERVDTEVDTLNADEQERTSSTIDDLD